MQQFRIEGGHRLVGTVAIEGSKNSALPIITAAALADGVSRLYNVPRYSDILDLCQILRELGATVEWQAGALVIDGRGLSRHQPPYHLAQRLRASTYLVGLLLARLRRAAVAFPGGCQIGARPINYHLEGLKALGARMWLEHGSIYGETDGLRGARIYVERASFGTTINLMIAASLARGTTVLENAAMEPEVVDLANFLNAMGARVRGAGTNLVRIEGVTTLQGVAHEVIPDRLEAGTFLVAGAITQGDVTVTGVIAEHLRTVLLKLEQAGATIEEGMDSVRLTMRGRPKAVDIETMPHPGFPTDLHPQMVALLAVAEGVSVVRETVFESRFAYIHDLARLGANIVVDRDTAIVRGVETLTGAPVTAQDIRGGAALVLAGLRASGVTEVRGVAHLDRGYHAIERKLAQLGAVIERRRLGAAEAALSV